MQDSEDDRSSVDLDGETVLIEDDEFEHEEDADAEDACISQTLKEIYESSKTQARIDCTSDISSSDRRLDALAKILEVYSDSTCVAACVINNKITVASNDLSSKSRGVGSATTISEDRIKEIYQYFKDIADTGIIPGNPKRKEIFENLCKKAKYQSTNAPFYNVLEPRERDGLINAIMQSQDPGSQDLLKSLQQHADFMAAKGNWLVLYRAFRKLERDLSEKFKNAAHEKISNEYFQAFKNDVVILREEQATGVHAEAQLIASLLRQVRAGQAKAQKYYIGIGKLCCLHCRVMLEVTNTKMDSRADLEGLSIGARGQHDISFGTKWVSPASAKNPLLQDILKETKQHVKEVLDNAESGYHAVMHPNVSHSGHSGTPVSSPGQPGVSTEPVIIEILQAPVSRSYTNLPEDEKRLVPLLVHLLKAPEFSDLFERSLMASENPSLEENFKGILQKAAQESIFSESLEEDFIKILKSPSLIGASMVDYFKSISDKLAEDLAGKRESRDVKRSRP